MAVATSLIVGSIIAGAVSSAGTVAAARSQAGAARRAGNQQAQAVDQQIDFEREQAAEDQRRYDETQARNREMYEQTRAEEQKRYEQDRALEMQRWDTEQTRRTPYRDVSVANLHDLDARTRRGSTLADLARR